MSKILVHGWYPKPDYKFEDRLMIPQKHFIFTTREFEVDELIIAPNVVQIGHLWPFVKIVNEVSTKSKPFDFFYVLQGMGTVIEERQMYEERKRLQKEFDDDTKEKEQLSLEQERLRLNKDKLKLEKDKLKLDEERDLFLKEKKKYPRLVS